VPRRVDTAVVGEQRRRKPPARARFPEHLQDLGGRREREDLARHRESGVVIDEVHDLRRGPVPEAPVGHVGLPALVRQLRLEAHPGAPRPLVGLGGHEASPAQHPPDRRHRGHLLVSEPEVVVDRAGASVKAKANELLAQRNDLVLELIRRAVGDALGCPGPRLDRGVPARSEPADQLANPTLGHTVRPGDLSVAPPLDHDRVHHVASQIHRRPPSKVSTMLRHMCPLSGDLRHSSAHHRRPGFY